MTDRLPPEREAEIIRHMEYGILDMPDMEDLFNDRERLRELLVRAATWVVHRSTCAMNQSGPCTCGLSEWDEEAEKVRR